MDRLIATNSVPAGAADVAPVTGTPQYATSGNPVGNVPATDFPAYQYNAIQEELIGVIAGAALVPDRTNNGQVLAAIKALIASAAGNPSLAVMTSTGSFTPTVTGWYKITLLGAGGGGANGGNVGGAAGGAGATAVYWAALTAGTPYSVTIGAGGAGGAQRNSTDAGLPGSNGGASTIVIGATTVTAGGGQGGQAATDPGQAGTGGAATNGTLNVPGGDGTNSIWSGTGGIVTGGTGGASSLGGGGAGSAIPGNAGNNGNVPGSGGGGGSAVAGVQYAGGNGANGICIIQAR